MALLVSLALAAFLQTAPTVPGQAPGSAVNPTAADPTEKGSIAGHVTNAVTGEPLKKVRVTLRRSGSTGAIAVPATDSVVTDASGSFQFLNVYPGDCTLIASRPGFAGETRASSSASGRMLRIALAPGEKASDVKLRIAPEGIISGRVVDENGEPARNVSVYALRPTYMQGVRSLISAGITTNSTNDLGEYRIFGLTPGRYYVRAQALRSSPAAAGLATSADRIYPEVYYPGAPDLETAAKVEVRAGAEAGNTNFKLRPARAASIRGRVVDGATGQATERAYVMASPTGAGVSGMSSLASANTKGEFEIDGLLPGSYTLTATGVSASWTLSARDTVTVGDSGLTGVLLRLTAGATLAGTLRADDALAAAGLDLSKLRVQLLRLESGPPMFFSGGPIGASPAQAAAALPGAVDAQGNFVLEGVSAFRNQVIVSGLPAPCYLKSASLENRETIDTGLEAAGMGRYRLDVVVSGDGAQFDGLVLDRQDKPAVQAMVTLVPADPASRPPRLYRSTDTDQNGQFTLKAIPPGRYLIYAWQDVEDGAWFDPEFMARYEKLGESVSFDPQEHKTLNLKLLSTSEDPSH